METGLSSLSNPSFRLFPNPNEGLFYLESLEEPILSYQIINSLGEIVLEQSLATTAPSKIDLRKQAKGIYFVSVQTNQGITMGEILVQ